MRMRRRSHLEDKIKECEDWLCVMEEYGFYNTPEEERYNLLDLQKIFGNDNPIHLEIGCGKGDFILQNAIANPNVNYLAVEKISNVIILGLQRAYSEKIPNLRFLNCNASNLRYYLKDDSVERVYLNFSCPYPKHAYRNSRLTHRRFLDIYKSILTKGGEIWQKTDNMGFFEFSLASLSQNGFIIKEVQLDLHNSDFKGNVLTEYEVMFSSKGLPIYRLCASYEEK